MFNQLEKTQKKWGGDSDVIDYWLSLRQQLLVEYSKVAGLAGDSKQCLPSEDQLNHFCGTLVDYISAGHFKIYDMVMERWKSTGFATNSDIDSLYARIIETTDPLLNFNDMYNNFDLNEDNFTAFDNDVSAVGEIMEQRFEREDMLIQLIANSLAIPPGA